jgi:hypothetical protein
MEASNLASSHEEHGIYGEVVNSQTVKLTD